MRKNAKGSAGIFNMYYLKKPDVKGRMTQKEMAPYPRFTNLVSDDNNDKNQEKENVRQIILQEVSASHSLSVSLYNSSIN